MTSSSRPRAMGFTLVELLVVIAIIAILVLLLLPAINAARESARVSICKNNIRQLGVALHAHHGARGRLPSGWISDDPAEPDGEPGWGWAVHLLPYLEEQQLYETGFHLKTDVADPLNEAARQTVVNVFLCPTDSTPPLVTLEDEDDGSVLFDVARSNYVGVYGTEEVEDAPADGDGVLFLNSRIRFRDITDGLSKTIVLGERSSKLGGSVWVGVVEGADEGMARVVGSADHTPNSPEGHFEDFSSHHPTGAHFLLGDGAVLLLTDQVDLVVYRALATRAGRESIPSNFGD